MVVGGGATGVELAGQIAELSRSGLKGNFRGIDPTEARVVLVDGGQEILAAFGDRLSHKAATELQRLEVTIRTGVVVTGVDAFGVDLTAHDGAQDRIACRTKIWAAGVSASPNGQMIRVRAADGTVLLSLGPSFGDWLTLREIRR